MTGRRSDTAWWWAAVGATALLALIGIANPSAASRAVLVAIVCLAAFALVHAVRRLWQRVGPAPASPFSRTPASTIERAPLPHHLDVLRPAPAAGGHGTISFGARVGLRTVATERLWKQHRLNLWEPAHAAAVRTRVSDELWAAINVGAAGAPIPQTSLDRLLDEVEQL